MTAVSIPRRLVAALFVGLVIALAAPVEVSAAPDPNAPASPTALRIDMSTYPVTGSVNIAWDASPSAGVTQYLVRYRAAFGAPIDAYVEGDDLTFTIPGVQLGVSYDVDVQAIRSGINSYPAFLRFTGLDDGPSHRFTDTASTSFLYEIAWLSSTRITTGYEGPAGSRSCAPSAPVLREQMAAFLYRLAEPGFPEEYVPPAESPFVDVPTTATFYREIAWLASEGISTGYTEVDGVTTFRPSQPVLREQMAAFLYRYDESTYTEDFQKFADVPLDARFYAEIAWLSWEGITTGYTEPVGLRTFRGSQPVLREQMAAFLYRYENGRFGEN